MRTLTKTDRTVPAAAVVLAAALLGAALPAAACDVPVFRYALERWPASFYNVLVFHRGELTGEAKAAADWLGGLADDPNRPCNVAVRPFDVSTAESDDANVAMPRIVQPIWEACKDKPLPWMVACYPGTMGKLVEAWSGPATRAAASRLADSPTRQQIVEKLLAGDSAVWVMLECGDPTKDDANAAKLRERLAELTKQVKLPNADAPDADLDGVDYAVGPKLRVGFSMLRLSRDDPAEAAFIQMLLATENDLADVTADEPAVFPVFGQGRALWALVGAGINEENIAEYAYFLAGPCSCMVKEQNPGVDLLIAADWFAPFRDAPTITAPLPGAIAAPSTRPAPTAQAPRAQSGSSVAQIAQGMSSLLRNVLLAAGAIVLIAVVLGLVALRRTPGNR